MQHLANGPQLILLYGKVLLEMISLTQTVIVKVNHRNQTWISSLNDFQI